VHSRVKREGVKLVMGSFVSEQKVLQHVKKRQIKKEKSNFFSKNYFGLQDVARYWWSGWGVAL